MNESLRLQKPLESGSALPVADGFTLKFTHEPVTGGFPRCIQDELEDGVITERFPHEKRSGEVVVFEDGAKAFFFNTRKARALLVKFCPDIGEVHGTTPQKAAAASVSKKVDLIRGWFAKKWQDHNVKADLVDSCGKVIGTSTFGPVPVWESESGNNELRIGQMIVAEEAMESLGK